MGYLLSYGINPLWTILEKAIHTPHTVEEEKY